MLENIFRQFLKQLNINLSYDLATVLLGTYPRQMKTYVHTKTYTQESLASLLVIAKTYKNKIHYNI